MQAQDALISYLGTVIAGAGALGTACFGITEGLKWTPLGEMGFRQIKRYLGPALLNALAIAYGPKYEALLRAQYREDSVTQSGLAKTLRQGVRVGLARDNAEAIAVFLGSVSPAALGAAATNMTNGGDLSASDRAAIGRFELAVDARIDSALSSAKDVYLGSVRCTAALLAILIAEAIGHLLQVGWIPALIVGILAVPFAPIANDLVGAIQAATKALKAR
jgi:hypothetical protein